MNMGCEETMLTLRIKPRYFEEYLIKSIRIQGRLKSSGKQVDNKRSDGKAAPVKAE